MDITNLQNEIAQIKAADMAIKPYEEDELLAKYKELLTCLRKDGVNRITELRQKIASAKKNKMIEPEEKLLLQIKIWINSTLKKLFSIQMLLLKFILNRLMMKKMLRWIL